MSKPKSFLLLFFSSLVLLSCSREEEINPSFEFTDAVYGCGTYLLYKTTSTQLEAYILTLDELDLTTTEGTQVLNLSNTRTLTYRIFDSEVDGSYFCQNLPPQEPSIVQNWIASAASIEIVTSAILSEDETQIEGYEYDINLLDVVLNDGDQEIRQDYYEFGSITASVE